MVNLLIFFQLLCQLGALHICRGFLVKGANRNFQGTGPFHLNYSMYVHWIIHSVFSLPFQCLWNSSFIPDIGNLSPFFFFWSVWLEFYQFYWFSQRTSFWFHLTFSIVFTLSIPLISTLILIIFFLLLTSDWIFYSFSSFLGRNWRSLFWDLSFFFF